MTMRGSGIDQWDWQEEHRQRQVQPIRGTSVTPTPQTSQPPVCGRNIDGSVLVGTPGNPAIGTGVVGTDKQASYHPTPVISASSYGTRSVKRGATQTVLLTFTETNFGTVKPLGLDNIVVYVAADGDTSGADQILVDPASYVSANSNGSQCQYQVNLPAGIGSTITAGIAYEGCDGKQGTITWLGSIPDPNGDFADVATGSIKFARHDATVQTGSTRANAAIDSGNVAVASAVDFSRAYANKGVLATKNAIDRGLVAGGYGNGTNLIYNPSGSAGTLTGWTSFGTPGGTSPLIEAQTFAGGRFHIFRSASTATADYLLYQQFTAGYSVGITVSGVIEVNSLTLGGGTGVWVDLYDATSSTVAASLPAITANQSPTLFSFYASTITAGHNYQVRLRTACGTVDSFFYKIKAEYGTTATIFDDNIGHAITTQIHDQTGALLASSTMNRRVPNSSAFGQNTYIQGNCRLTSGTYYLDIWVDNGAAASPSFLLADNSSSFWNGTSTSSVGGNGSSASPLATVNLGTSIATGVNVYVLAYYTPGTGWTCQGSKTPFTLAQVGAAFQDGGYMAVFGTATGGPAFTVTSTGSQGGVRASGSKYN